MPLDSDNKETELYNLKRGDWFVLTEETHAPPDIGSYPQLTQLKLNRIDGMYSHCTDMYGNVYHPVAWARVEKREPQ